MIKVVDNDIETLATALYVKIDDMLNDWPDLRPARPQTSTPLTLSDAELLALAVMSALMGFTSERRWLRYANGHLAGMFPALIGQSGYNKRIRKAFWLFIRVIRMLAMDTTLWSDDVWVVDSTPVECGRSGETVRRSDVAGWAQYGYCASHSRFFWGLRLHLVCTLSGLPVLFAIAGAKADERQTLLGMLEAGRDVAAAHPGQTLIGDKNYFGTDFEAELAARHLVLLRPLRKGEAPRAGQNLFKPLRQVIESVNQTLKGQLDLERHGGRTDEGILARILARILALTAAIWHNDKTGQPVDAVPHRVRPLTAKTSPGINRLGIDPQHRLLVSPRLRADSSNGDQFYAKAGQVIDLPERRPTGPAGSSWSGTSTRSSSRQPQPDQALTPSGGPTRGRGSR